MLYLKLLEKQEQAKSKTCRRREIIKVGKITKIDKLLANLTKMRGKRPKISKSERKKAR
jgi:RNA polymerase-interacting CarD/CdnL/TRCF family regulator